MAFIVIAAITLTLVTAFVLYRRNVNANRTPEYHIKIIVPFSETIQLDENDFIFRYKTRWNTEIGLSKFKEYGKPGMRHTQYLLEQDPHSIQ